MITIVVANAKDGMAKTTTTAILRRYSFTRLSDRKLLVKGEADWVFVDTRRGLPRAVPEEIIRIFPLMADEGTA
jgi:acyl-CoA thioesterase FadM